jgi:transcriptional regulator with XRE-family HTH domain
MEEENLKKLGNRLRLLRIQKGYSNYEQFAYTHGISRAQYGRYENGANISFKTLSKLIAIHDMTVAEFFQEGFD